MTATATLPPATPDAVAPAVLERRLFAPTTAAFAVVAVVFLLLDVGGVRVPPAVQAVPFAVSVLLFGLPHGALDHLVPARLDPRIGRRRSITAVVLLYALLGGATALVWVLLPAAGFVLFIAVTWFHWGQGDLWLDRALRRAPASRLDGALTAATRGALPMLLPLVAHPDAYAAVLTATTRLVDPAGPTGPGPIGAVPLRVAAAVLVAVLIAAHLALRARTAPVRTAAAEIAVLVVFFTAVPSVLAVGLYFTFWHAVRHIVRLELCAPGGPAALEQGELLRPFARFLRDAAPVTLCAVALLAGLALLLHDAGLGTYLLLIAALTTPHAAVVAWMDARRARLTASASARASRRPWPRGRR